MLVENGNSILGIYDFGADFSAEEVADWHGRRVSKVSCKDEKNHA